MPIEIKVVDDAGYDAFSDAFDVGFHSPGTRGRGRYRSGLFTDDLAAGRMIGAYDGDRVVGTFGNYQNRVTVPGGAAVPVSAVSSVTVAQTHRRRGILSSMAATALRQTADAGEPLSMLIPAEWPIYGRFGYGHATDETRYTFDTKRCRVARPLPGTVEYVSAAELIEEGRGVYERLRRSTPGAIERRNSWWEREVGLLTPDGKPTDLERLYVVYRDEDGTARGFAYYKPEQGQWEGFVPDNSAEAYVVAEDHVARVRLLQFLWEQDWLSSFTVEKFTVDDSWRRLMADPRVARQKQRYDVLWVRVLDVVAALQARTYESEGRLVLAVTDAGGYAEGVYALEGGPSGATVKRTSKPADLTLPVQTLGSLYLGHHAASALARVGDVSEERAGALAVADRMFRTAVPPYCVTWF